MIKTVFVSDVGHVRSVNEDSAWAANLEQGYTLGIVADGMGGHQAGDTASRLAVETIVSDLSSLSRGTSFELRKEALRKAMLHANDVVYRRASGSVEMHNMGTTAVVVLMDRKEAIIGHIGDSRVYIYRKGGLTQLTEDHTLVHELVKSGQITEEEATQHPRRNVITRAVGTDAQVTVDLEHILLQDGDVMLLCSDGLSSYVAEHHILQTVGRTGVSLEDRAEQLLKLALDAGGEDNITVVLVEVLTAAGSSVKEWNK
ncbi:serine/threonine protein phosphatase PrpC [Paenibacillus shirakamiensis]|uniref:Serine/threonine protein phosphatase PrpC n=1 Tax=Paenibacillus shirakamiensis TaxID=1265935 RepID=A0ABS4JCA2_9BACL|nr:Stp1/IreP family PP2C-type Ser/Thr phosphatase [Paenibacillus shirakamiensis]MBP1999355.1 serine/threonine protein phosphatase PrpC [Paenibacillus shirakamiensis]